MDVQQRMDRLIEARDERTLIVAGRSLRARGEASAWAERLRSELTRRFVERRPNATEHTWQRFVVLLTAYAEELDEPSGEALQDMLALVDGL